jgi:hypothetical protein
VCSRRAKIIFGQRKGRTIANEHIVEKQYILKSERKAKNIYNMKKREERKKTRLIPLHTKSYRPIALTHSVHEDECEGGRPASLKALEDRPFHHVHATKLISESTDNARRKGRKKLRKKEKKKVHYLFHDFTAISIANQS